MFSLQTRKGTTRAFSISYPYTTLFQILQVCRYRLYARARSISAVTKVPLEDWERKTAPIGGARKWAWCHDWILLFKASNRGSLKQGYGGRLSVRTRPCRR